MSAAIGLQGHFAIGQPNLAYMRSSLDLLATTGLPIWLTELTVEPQPNELISNAAYIPGKVVLLLMSRQENCGVAELHKGKVFVKKLKKESVSVELMGLGIWGAFVNWLRSLFFKQEMELSLVSLQDAGKTSLINVIAIGGYSEEMIPTVGFNMKKITKGNVTIKLRDLGGQPRFRRMWERYCRAISAIVYVVDAADYESLPGNKIDKPGALSKQDLTDQMGLRSITDRELCCFMISCKNSTSIDTVVDWLVKNSKSIN
ncbi:hypothetical protein VNO80_10003 [Phaseolus coccineus]|uniref:Uncharacterized protein n=1 Tax=Phaseolus coccineus TaxID=3886 RepID=A0AAN9RDE7_PHACN